jgi:hypothetical protein
MMCVRCTQGLNTEQVVLQHMEQWLQVSTKSCALNTDTINEQRQERSWCQAAAAAYTTILAHMLADCIDSVHRLHHY